jgi:hypothetical protein
MDMATIKFAQTIGDVTEGKEYPITKSYEEDEILYYYFVDNSNEISVVRKVVGQNTDEFFTVIA